ncbi:MAG: serine/threonine-protein kinase [Verrucomicrobiota bacterium]
MTVAEPKDLQAERCLLCKGVLEPDGICLRCFFNEAIEAPAQTAVLKSGTSGTSSPVFARLGRITLPCDFAKHRLVREIASGGMGIIYEAQDLRLKRTVALKMVRCPALATHDEVARFRAEAEAVANLDHPNIVPLYDVGEEEGVPYFTMRLVVGESLSTRLQRAAGPVPTVEAVRLMCKVARAVQHAHERGILHRDLKPANILLEEGGEPQLTDFGVAKLLDADTQLTRSYSQLGTPHYMSPEQAAGRSSEITTVSDVWSLGVILYQLLTGRLPFTGDSVPEILRKVVDAEAEPFVSDRLKTSLGHLTHRTQTLTQSGRDRDAPTTMSTVMIRDRDLATIVARCLEKDPAKRPASAGYLAEELERWRLGTPIRLRQVTSDERLWKWVRRHKTAACAILLTSLSLVVGSWVSVWMAVAATRAQHATERLLMDADAATDIMLGTLGNLASESEDPLLDRNSLVTRIVDEVRSYRGDPLRKVRLLSKLADVSPNTPAIKVREEALALAQPLLPADDMEIYDLRFALAKEKAVQAHTREDAMADLRSAHDWYLRKLGASHPKTVHSAYQLGRSLNFTGKSQEAVTLLSQALNTAEKKPAAYEANAPFLYRLDYALALNTSGRQDEALAEGRKNVAQALKELGPQSYLTGRVLLNHAEMCEAQGRQEEAVSIGTQALEIFFAAANPQIPPTQRCLALVIRLRQKSRNFDAVVEVLQMALSAYHARLQGDDLRTTSCVKNLSQALIAADRTQEAETLIKDWLDRLTLAEGGLQVTAEPVLRAYLELLRKDARWAEAETCQKQIIALLAKFRPDDKQRWGDTSGLAQLLMSQGRHAEAVPLLEEAATQLETADGRLRDEVLPLTKSRLETARKSSGKTPP